MSGTKGHSGGARANSGGARPGSGPKPKPKQKLAIPRKTDPLKFLLSVMNDADVDAQLRVRAAVAAAQYVHAKRGEGGKKEAAEQAAQNAASGRFTPAAPPKLVVNNK